MAKSSATSKRRAAARKAPPRKVSRQLAALAARRRRYKDAPAYDNSSTYAGTPMYYRCKGCGDPQGVCVPESWVSKPDYCIECDDLRSKGLL